MLANLPWRLIGYGVAVAALIGLVAWFSHARYSAGEAAGKAQIQREWDRERAAAKRAYEAQEKATREKVEADRKAAQEVESGLRQKLADADASGRDLARRLRDYQARARGGSVPAAPEAPGEPAGTSGEPSRDEAIGRATEDVFALCKRDAARVDGWDQWCNAVNCWAESGPDGPSVQPAQ